MKFGGTSVADIDRIRNVARHVKREVDAGHQVAVIVSAMAGKTNELVGWTDDAGPAAAGLPASDDEYDVVVASGEQVTIGLLALALRKQARFAALQRMLWRKLADALPGTIADPAGRSDRRFLETFAEIERLVALVASRLFGPARPAAAP